MPTLAYYVVKKGQPPRKDRIMKFKTTKTTIKNNYSTIISAPYCSIQTLCAFREPIAYIDNEDGWRADIYECSHDVAIVTGYAPFGNVHPSYELCRTFEEKAEALRDCSNREELAIQLLNDFVAAAINESECGGGR